MSVWQALLWGGFSSAALYIGEGEGSSAAVFIGALLDGLPEALILNRNPWRSTCAVS